MNKGFAKVISYLFMFLLGSYTYGHFVGEPQEVDLYRWIVSLLLFTFFVIEGNKKE